MDFRPEKRLGFGLMRLPRNDANNPADINMDELKQMVDLFMEKGFTYFDTGWMYCGFASEDAVKEALVDRYPRESYTLATKLHSAFFNSAEERDAMFEEQLRKTGAGYFDYYLLHGVDTVKLPKYEKYDCFEWIRKKKEEGLVKHVGFSFHDSADVLDRVLTEHPEMEFVQIQFNYLDWDSPWVQSGAVYEVAQKHGVPVIVMEPVKGGTLAQIPEEAENVFRAYDPDASPASWAIRFAASFSNVMVVLSGMSSYEQMKDNLSYMEDFKRLTLEENDLCVQAARIINEQIAIPCTACAYCREGCPKNIAIPDYFSMYNEDNREDLATKGWTANITNFAVLSKKFGKPSECIECGKCESVCPQHLPVIEYMKEVAAHFESEKKQSSNNFWKDDK